MFLRLRPAILRVCVLVCMYMPMFWFIHICEFVRVHTKTSFHISKDTLGNLPLSLLPSLNHLYMPVCSFSRCTPG